MKIGFIGVGAMGAPMAKNLLKSDYVVYVNDLDTEKVVELEKLGAIACETAADVAKESDLIITSLPNAAIVEAVMTGDNGLFTHCKPGTVVMDMSSVAPHSSQKMAGIAAEYQLGYVDAPVSGGVKGAEEGTLTIMVGAEQDVFDKIKPVLETLGKNIIHVGNVGAGDAIKIVNNLLLGCNMAALAEALVLGAQLGLNPETVLQVVGVSSGKSYAFDAIFKSFILAGKFDGGFSIDLQHKDLGLALAAGDDVSAQLPMTQTASKVFEMAQAKGLNRQDISAIIKVWEDLAGVEVRLPSDTDDK